MAICIVLLIGTISIPGILGQSDEINNNNNNNNRYGTLSKISKFQYY
jgi:hypothetical protein